MTLNAYPYKNSTIVCLIAGLLFIYLAHLQTERLKDKSLKVSQQTKAININENIIKSISFGQYRLLSSLLWSETLLKAGVKHYKGGDYNNWMFLRLKLMTSLDPYFYQAYLYGGIYLSIIKDDDLGAEFIYDRGLRYFPNDLNLNMNASYHYLFEVHNIQKGIAALERAEKLPNSPSHIPRLIAKYQAQQGNLADAKLHLTSLLKGTPEDSSIRKRYLKQIESLQIEIDLNCLNGKGESCNRNSPNGMPYLKNIQNRWISQQPWEPFSAKKKPSH